MRKSAPVQFIITATLLACGLYLAISGSDILQADLLKALCVLAGLNLLRLLGKGENEFPHQATMKRSESFQANPANINSQNNYKVKKPVYDQ